MSGEESGFVRVVTGCTLSMTMLFHVILVFSTFVTTIMHLICICTVIMFLKMLWKPNPKSNFWKIKWNVIAFEKSIVKHFVILNVVVVICFA